MKTHAIIPIFISHRGCPNQCVFCNQRVITTRSGDVTVEEAKKTVDQWLTTLDHASTEIELSYFGGSFTGIPMEEQTAFLKLAKEYKDRGLVDKLHCSTRPDYIDEKILDNLKLYGMDVIELGVQTFDQSVLDQSKRNHSVEAVEKACKLIQEYGFTLGIQLMIGLPGDSYESCIFSAQKTVEMHPQIARLYPTVVLDNTELSEMYTNGSYVPYTQDETVRITKDMYCILTKAGINVIRIGLKSNELIKGETYHPAIGQIVKSAAARDEIEKMIEDQLSIVDRESKMAVIEILASEKLFNFAVGYEAANKKYFTEMYSDYRIRFLKDNDLERFKVNIRV